VEGGYTLSRVTTTRWLTGLWSTQTKVEGIVLQAAWHWGSDSSVIKDPLGEPGCTPLHVGLPSTWGSVDGDCIFSPHFVGDVFLGNLTEHLYIMGLISNPTCRKCGTENETSVHVLCECEALASLRHAYLGSFFLDPKDVRNLNIGANWKFGKGTGLL
jgi:hypothetical protein